MRKQRRPMSEIVKDIEANNRRKPTQAQLDELFLALKEAGLTQPVKKKHAGPTLLDKLPKNEGEHIELMIRMTEKATQPTESHQYLRDQADRLRAKLAEWKKNNPES